MKCNFVHVINMFTINGHIKYLVLVLYSGYEPKKSLGFNVG